MKSRLDAFSKAHVLLQEAGKLHHLCRHFNRTHHALSRCTGGWNQRFSNPKRIALYGPSGLFQHGEVFPACEWHATAPTKYPGDFVSGPSCHWANVFIRCEWNLARSAVLTTPLVCFDASLVPSRRRQSHCIALRTRSSYLHFSFN